MNTLFSIFFIATGISFGFTCRAIAADAPPATEEFRAQLISEDNDNCVKAIEDKPDLRALYSHKTIETYCTCRQRYRADIIAQAIKDNERGKSVSDRAADYAQEKCVHILLNGLEQE
jgi:hypothetical protein